MSNNIFSGKRFLMLFKQHFIHNNQLLLLATVAYVGVIFIVLSLVQVGQDFKPHDLENFRGFMIAFIVVFGILYAGYSFPAFRSKESTINYLMIPGSILEKFMFELISRIGIMLILLPLLYWITFHLQGYFIAMFTNGLFEPIGFQYLSKLDFPEIENLLWLSIMIGAATMLGFILPFTGAAMFSKQPLIKTLFSVAVIIAFYIGFAYIVIEHLGLRKYSPNDSAWFIPSDGIGAFQYFSVALILTNLIMLFVAFRKLKEREV